MAKYHINLKGEPSQCHASKGNCPFGGAEQHFGTQQEAYQEAEHRFATEAVAEQLTEVLAEPAVDGKVDGEKSQLQKTETTNHADDDSIDKDAGPRLPVDNPQLEAALKKAGFDTVLYTEKTENGYKEVLLRTNPETGKDEIYFHEHVNGNPTVERIIGADDKPDSVNGTVPASTVTYLDSTGKPESVKTEFYNQGVLNDGANGEPAVHWESKTTKATKTEHYAGGTLHNTSGPAVEKTDEDGGVVLAEYRVGGWMHRIDGPAYYSRDKGVETTIWKQNNMFHNLNGPALEKRDVKTGQLLEREFHVGGRIVSPKSDTFEVGGGRQIIPAVEHYNRETGKLEYEGFCGEDGLPGRGDNKPAEIWYGEDGKPERAVYKKNGVPYRENGWATVTKTGTGFDHDWATAAETPSGYEFKDYFVDGKLAAPQPPQPTDAPEIEV